MYTKKNIVYSDAGKYLVYNNRMIGLQFANVAEADVEERDIDITAIGLSGSVAIVDKGILRINVEKFTMDWLKPYIIHLRYTDNDQMALILNREDSEEGQMYYDKMQEWRAFASNLSKEIIKYHQNFQING